LCLGIHEGSTKLPLPSLLIRLLKTFECHLFLSRTYHYMRLTIFLCHMISKKLFRQGLKKNAKFGILDAAKLKPKIPKMINIASLRLQNKHDQNICCFVNPWRRSIVFCAPIARIRDNEVKKPVRPTVSIIKFSLITFWFYLYFW